MPYNTFPISVIGPSYPITKKAQPKVISSSFGDGYTQDTPNGLNHLLYEWSLSWKVLEESEAKIIENFLIAQGGYKTFLWTDDFSRQYKVKCREWTVEEFEPKIFAISATFKQTPI